MPVKRLTWVTMFASIALILVIICLAWLIGLTMMFKKMNEHYNRIISTNSELDLRKLLDQLLESSENNKKDIEKLAMYCDRIDKEGQLHIQRVGLLRFNPFKETGGDQSFILSLLDKRDSGVIISGLYSRSGLRWYAKKVQNGKGIEHQLSDDEIRALKEAKNNYA